MLKTNWSETNLRSIADQSNFNCFLCVFDLFYCCEKSIYLIILLLIYLVNRLNCLLNKSSEIIINNPVLLMIRFKIIYNWSWIKIFDYKHKSTCYKNWSCDLLIIILKIKRIEYWIRRNEIYKLFESSEARDIRKT